MNGAVCLALFVKRKHTFSHWLILDSISKVSSGYGGKASTSKSKRQIAPLELAIVAQTEVLSSGLKGEKVICKPSFSCYCNMMRNWKILA